MISAACYITGGLAPGAALEALLAKEALSLASIDLVCCETQTEQTSSRKYNIVLCSRSSPHSRESLARVARSMAPGGRLYVYEAAQSNRNISEPESRPARLEALKKDLLLSGFTDAVELSSNGASASTGAEPVAWVTAQLPSWGLGATAKLTLKRAAPQPAQAAAPAATSAPPIAAPAAANVWKLGAGGDEDGDEELLDEEALLAPEDKAPAAAPKQDDCEVGSSGRKACKNCSCGRAEAEASGEKLTQEMLDNPTSSCGNCYLGDAFRCGTCPYRGLPAFEPGQKISLAAAGLAADI